MHTFMIAANDAGQRADKFLLKACPKLPKSLLYKAFRKRDIKCNGKRIPAETFLSAGDILQVYLPDDCFGAAQKTAATVLPKPEIVYEDEDIMLLKKPVYSPYTFDLLAPNRTRYFPSTSFSSKDCVYQTTAKKYIAYTL